jgi:hypothetical protein
VILVICTTWKKKDKPFKGGDEVAGWKKTENCKPTITITVDEEMLNRLEDYKFEKRFNSRSEAINSIIEFGMEWIAHKELLDSLKNSLRK